ncbi:cob(I)yrinic acid a,c-diamide adenosyltransferase [Pelosinus propionicus]|uniref:Cob(I)yrinic acid a,c-diamide adenosyltransferase n=1 Tax=Pelosinus propionicus DSM 13327 TaxID=1123291 RepID=A0A1I4H9U6_9FIRM|nr:cob(I)yrinic acid a,c-diamide adenosyltransferase [Pelosinus propionicus]SFL38181.1 cob(I)yrinic acid a,c-diamide adenosyltransferase [Pelosinus propionicus DSM 13327]
MTSLGLIQVYTGDGKGKTTASLGLAFRACGHGFQVCMIQFMKDNTEYGEFKSSSNLPGFTLFQVGRNDFVNLENPEAIDKKLAQDGWNKAKHMIVSGKYDIVILDEINVAMACKIVDVHSVVSFLTEDRMTLTKIPEIILTGRYAPHEIINIAHLVTEMKEIRHNFSTGMESRQGIEF